jgi:hypothetical protein
VFVVVEIDWQHGQQHMWESHGITPQEANEAVNDPVAAWFIPDYASRSGKSIRVIGYSPTAARILTVILVDDRTCTLDYFGSNAWPANDKDSNAYLNDWEERT